MISRFRLKYGFSFWVVLLIPILIWFMLVFSGLFKTIPICFLIIIVAFMYIKYDTYNSQPWRRVHYPAMIMYARILGSVFDSQKERPDLADKYTHNNCKILLARILNRDVSDQQVCSAMLKIQAAKGEYLSSMLEAYVGDNFKVATLSEIDRYELLQKTLKDNIDMGPHLVIAKAIEILYGKEEAGKYAVALLKGEAK